MKNNVIIIANPTSGTASTARVRKAVELFAKRDINAKVRMTTGPGDAKRLAREATKERPRFVMAAGGDGTMNEVLNGLAGSDTPMAIMPMGTANVLALETGIPFSSKGAVEGALNGSEHVVQLCRATFDNGEKYFGLMAGIGFDAAVVQGIDGSAIKKRMGKLAYVGKALGLIIKWAPEMLMVEADGAEFKCHNIIILNGAKYAGNFLISPGSNITKAEMDVLLIHGSSRLAVIKFALAMLLGIQPGKLNGITAVKTGNLRVNGAAHMQIEGDYAGLTPVIIEAGAATLRMIY